jgi:hypothetical protein
LEPDFAGAHAERVSTQGDIGPMTDFTDEDESEFPGLGSGGYAALREADVPHARTEPYRPLAGRAWGPPPSAGAVDAGAGHPRPGAGRGSFAAYAADDYDDYGVEIGAGYSHRVPQELRKPFGEPEFEVFRLEGTLAGAAVAPGSMLTRWFGEPAQAAVMPGARHGLPSPVRRVTKRHKTSHRAGPDPAGRQRRAVDPEPVRAGREFTLAFVASALVLAGLVYLHGRSRAQARANYLGFDESVLGTSGRDYLVDGLRALCLPLLAVVAGVLGVRLVHSGLLSVLRRHRRVAAWCTNMLRCAWLVVPAAVWFVVHRRPAFEARWWALTLPCAITAGVVITAYAALLARQIGAHRGDAGTSVRPWSVVLTGAVLALCLLWVSGAYAAVTGRDDGRALAHGLHRRTSVVLYSVQDLRMPQDEGIVVREDSAASYRYRYTGLRLLRQSPRSLYLLPEHWSWERPRLLVVREDARLRVEYERTR